ncbi:MAG: HAD-IC family P-type ATPase [Methermicoccaceae archaeon]
MKSMAVVLDSAGTLVRAHRVIRLTSSEKVLTHTPSTQIASRNEGCALVSLGIDPEALEGEGCLCELALSGDVLMISCARAGIGEEHIKRALLHEQGRALEGRGCATIAELKELREQLAGEHGELDYITSGMLVDTEKGCIAGLVCAGGALEDSALAAVEQLKQVAEVHLCSGDSMSVVHTVAGKLKLPYSVVVGNCAPECKAAYVESLKCEGRTVVMVGDGINDLLAVRCADVGVAMAAYGTPPHELLGEADVVVHTHEELVEVVKGLRAMVC